MTLSELLLLAGVGIVAGWMNVMAGGGSLLSVPVMVFLGLPGPVANGTNRIAILAQNAIAVATFRGHGFSDFRLSLSLAAAAVPGAVAGAMLGTRLEGAWFNRIVALIMIAVMVVMLLPARQAATQTVGHVAPTRPRLLWGHALMVGAGFWGGFIQIGVGFMLMPILHRVLGLDLVRVNMHKVFIVLIYTAFALAVFASRVELVWVAGLFLAIGNAAGGWLGAHTSVRKGDRWIRMALFVILSVFIVRLLLS